MNPFDFDELPPPTAIPSQTRKHGGVWIISIAALVIIIASVGVVVGTRDANPKPATQTDEPPPTRIVQRTSSTPANTTKAGELTPEPPATVAEPPPEEKSGPRRKGEAVKLTAEQQAVWDKALAILAKPDQITLFALDPEPPGRELPREMFQDWKVLGKTGIFYPDPRNSVDDFVKTIRLGPGARCFEPRHGIRATAGRDSVDLVICLACMWVYVYLEIGGEDGGFVRLMIRRDDASLEKILTDAGVRRPKLLQFPD